MNREDSEVGEGHNTGFTYSYSPRCYPGLFVNTLFRCSSLGRQVKLPT